MVLYSSGLAPVVLYTFNVYRIGVVNHTSSVIVICAVRKYNSINSSLWHTQQHNQSRRFETYTNFKYTHI